MSEETSTFHARTGDSAEGRDDTRRENEASPAPPSPWRRRVTLGSLIVVLIAAAVVLPPLINVGRYQRQVTTLVSRSLGRPVQLSSVTLRLLPRPGFILHNLSVAEDPNFGTEPILSARTVVASIGILSLWKGNLALDRVSVDDASLNLVQTSQGRWNLEALMMGAQPTLAGDSSGSELASGNPASQPPAAQKPRPFPYLEATNSRVNLKRGSEKTPFSVVDTDLSLWQDNPGKWRVRLRGQPVRTDIEMSSADAGEVRLEASLQSAPEMKDMPFKLQMEWREAQLGQLSRLMLGSDAGWRGDLTADIDVQGTADAAQTKARLRATGVRREEFAPETPLDFDANCSFRYQHSSNALHNLACDTLLGQGHLQLTAELPGNSGNPSAMLQVKQLPLQAALDLIRTVRSGTAPGITAKGMANGSFTYKQASSETAPKSSASSPAQNSRNKRQSKALYKSSPLPAANLQGSLTVTGGILKGGGLKDPLTLPTMTWVPTAASTISNIGLETRFTLPIAAAIPAAPVPNPAVAVSSTVPASKSPESAKPAPAASPTPAATEPPAVSNPDHQDRPAAQSQDAKPSQPAPAAPSSDPADSSAPKSAEPTGASVATPAQSIDVHLAVAPSGYDVALNGAAATAKLRDLAYALGLPHSDALDGLIGGMPQFNLSAKGPWIPSSVDNSDPGLTTASDTDGIDSSTAATNSNQPALASKTTAKTKSAKLVSATTPAESSDSGTSAIWGTLQIRHAQWKPAYLSKPADLQQLVVTATGASITLTSNFTYGDPPPSTDSGSASIPRSHSISGTVTITSPASSSSSSTAACATTPCASSIQLHFGALDASQVQAVLLSGPSSKTGLALIDRVRDKIRPTNKPVYPQLSFTLQADSLFLGNTTLLKPVARVRLEPAGNLVLESWETGILGGTATGTGAISWAADKPVYEFEGAFNSLNPALAGALANAHWTGSVSTNRPTVLRTTQPVGSSPSTPRTGLNGTGKIKLTGLDWKALAASATGQIEFAWPGGTVPAASAQPLRFENWSGTLEIANGKAQLDKNTMRSGRGNMALAGQIPFGGVAKFSIANPTQQNASSMPPAPIPANH